MRVTNLLATLIIIIIFMSTYAFYCLRSYKKKIYTILAILFTALSIYLLVFVFQISMSDKVNEKTSFESYKITEITQNNVTYGDGLYWPVSNINNLCKNNEKYKNTFVVSTYTFDRSAKLFGVFDIYMQQKKMEVSIYVEDYVYEILSNKGQYIYQETKED